jgi:hypothetical protein
MSKELDIVKTSILPAANQDAGGYPVPFASGNSLFTFRYSYTEISAHGGNIHVKRKDTRFADGKLTSEECEGTLDHAAYDGMVRDTHNYFLNQMANFMQLFLPFSGRRRRYDE